MEIGSSSIVNIGAQWFDRIREQGALYKLTNHEVKRMFTKMVKGWFEGDDTKVYYNEFIRAMLCDNVRKMNTFMNKVALVHLARSAAETILQRKHSRNGFTMDLCSAWL